MRSQSVLSFFKSFRLIPSLERNSAVVNFSATPPGKLAMLLVFGLELYYFQRSPQTLLTTLSVLAAMTFLPQARHFFLAVVPIVLLVGQNLDRPEIPILNLGMLMVGMVLYACVSRWPNSLLARNPILILLGSFIGLVLYACNLTAGTESHRITWMIVAVAEAYLWFIGYALMDRGADAREGFPLQLAALRPFWGSTSVPFPKGAAFLRRIEAKTPNELAVTQLKGVKLLLWALLLDLFSKQWMSLFHDRLALPFVWDSVEAYATGTPLAWHIEWISVFLTFFEAVLTISVIGHTIIAVCRMAGFRAPRNTYRPLESTSISEFYDRFFYYYKELLVDYFFYPAFCSFPKRFHRARLVFATFAAAFAGNCLFHYLHYWEFIRDRGLKGSIINFLPFVVYAFALASLISISQARSRTRRPLGLFRRKLLAPLGVAFTYSLLYVFAFLEPHCDLWERVRFVAGLVFIHI